MPIRYVPILRWKRGERVGLQNLSHQAKQRATPLFLLGTDQYKIRPATKNRAAVPAVDALVAEIVQAWGGTPFFLDASAVPAVPGQPHPLQQIAQAATASGLQMIPATNLGAPQAYQAAVQLAAQAKGVGLRIDLQEVASLPNWAGQWPFPLQDTDLIIDFGQQIGTVASLGNQVDTLFQNLHSGTTWRTVTVAGTSMPENFTGYAQGLHLIPRSEWTLWQRLHALQLAYQLDYGDFTATSPGAPPLGIAYGYPINVKYTVLSDFLICRGVGTTGLLGVDPAVQLRNHANSIRNYPNRSRVQNIWSDTEIDAIAIGNASPQALEHWVRISVNRHIELVNLQLP